MKKCLSLFLIASLLAIAFWGCNRSENQPADEVPTNTTTDEQNQVEHPNPASDFEYEIINEGEIQIVTYLGLATQVMIPATIDDKPVTEIGYAAFYLNEKIVSVKIPDTVKAIGVSAFGSCTALETVVLSNSLETIWAEAFRNCSSLSNVVLPDSLTYLGTLAFAKCSSLKQIVIPSKCFTKSDSVSACFDSSGLESVTLSEGVAFLPPHVFRNTKIEKITLPNTTKEIGSSSFEGCENLTEVFLNEGLIKIGNQVFTNTNILEIIIPKTVTQLTEETFLGSPLLKKVKFEGDAPEQYVDPSMEPALLPFVSNYIVYYHSTAMGFTSPEWNGHPTEIW